MFPGNKNLFPGYCTAWPCPTTRFFQYLQATGCHCCWCSTLRLFSHHRFFDQRLSVGGGGANSEEEKTCWAQQTTRTFFSGFNNDHAPARQTTRFFFPVVITIAHRPDFCFFFRSYLERRNNGQMTVSFFFRS